MQKNYLYIIPYRNRETTLLKHLKNVTNIYKNFDIVVCEQCDNGLFKKSKLINTALKIMNNYDVAIIADVDTIPIKYYEPYLNDYATQIFGINNNTIISSGVVIYVNKDIVIMNGYSEHYNGWGFEDVDVTYRAFFNGIIKDTQNVIYRENPPTEYIDHKSNENSDDIYSHNKDITKVLNNAIFAQQVINYNLIYYMENKEKFIYMDNLIYYGNVLFFEGLHNNGELIKGTLHDLLINSKIYTDEYFKNYKKIYEGEFKYNLPNGEGKGYATNNKKYEKLDGEWMNGYAKKNGNCITEKILDTNNGNDYEIYKKFVYFGMDTTMDDIIACINDHAVDSKMIKWIKIFTNNKYSLFEDEYNEKCLIME